jgi:hypothetical protein
MVAVRIVPVNRLPKRSAISSKRPHSWIARRPHRPDKINVAE